MRPASQKSHMCAGVSQGWSLPLLCLHERYLRLSSHTSAHCHVLLLLGSCSGSSCVSPKSGYKSQLVPHSGELHKRASQKSQWVQFLPEASDISPMCSAQNFHANYSCAPWFVLQQACANRFCVRMWGSGPAVDCATLTSLALMHTVGTDRRYPFQVTQTYLVTSQTMQVA